MFVILAIGLFVILFGNAVDYELDEVVEWWEAHECS
jgi:hypothetical protein